MSNSAKINTRVRPVGRVAEVTTNNGVPMKGPLPCPPGRNAHIQRLDGHAASVCKEAPGVCMRSQCTLPRMQAYPVT